MSEPTTTLTATSVDPDLEPGQRVGEYIVEGKLGQGAFGTVFRASHPLIGKQVAIKVLARRFSVDPDVVSRFQAEAKAVNQIRHRHIIDIFSFSTLDDGRQYYVMEYLDGQTLDALLERNGKFSLRDVLPVLRGIGRALDAAHAKGIAHRDLKAENVFLATDPDGGVFPKLLDFGIAKLMAPDDGLKHKTRTGTPVGTPYYMSPEQCRGRDVDHRTDIYAFGVLAYLLLTGKYPHDADDYMSILMRQMTVEPELPSSLVPELPAGIDEAIMWLLQKDPADRPPSLRDAVGAFESAAENAGIAVGTAVWDVATGPVGTPTVGHKVSSKGGSRPPVKSSSSPPAKAPSSPPAKRPSKPPSDAWASAPTVHPGSGIHPQAVIANETSDKVVAPKRSGRVAAIAALLVVAATAIVVLVLRPWESIEQVKTVEPVKERVEPPKPAPGPAPQPQPTPVPQPKPPEAQTVIVTVEGVPEGTEVFAGGMTAGAAPGPVQLPRDPSPMVLTFKADGYLPASKTVTPDKDQTLKVTLKKKHRPVGGGVQKPGKDDIETIFKKKL